MVSRKRGRGRRIARPLVGASSWSRQHLAAAWRGFVTRVRPWRPAVAADVNGKRGRRLRKAIARVTRSHLRALGVTPPGHLLVVVQRTVVEEERPLVALLQVFEDGDGRRRQVLFLALSVEGRQVSDEEVVATLRQQLQRVVADELGTLRESVPLEAARARPAAALVPIRRVEEMPPFEDEAPPPEAFEGYDDGAFAVAAER
jgi:hypothetical protein